MAAVSRRDFLKTAGAIGAGAAAGIGFPAVLRAQGGGTVKVGVLHSLSGTMAISEVSLRDVCLMAFDEINAKGGVMGKKIEAIRQENEQLKRKLESRKLDERAKGILMTRLGLSEPEAFRRIQKTAMDTRKPMAEVAQALLLTEEVGHARPAKL